MPFAVVVSKLMGLQDPRSYGSGNPGATNVLRTGNKTAAALTLLGDAAKGWFAVWLAEQLAPGITPVALACVVVAAFLGHLYPIFLGFKGGKGVATALGVLVAIQPWLAVATAATWLIIAVFFRYSSLAALVAAFFAPVYVFGSGLVCATADRHRAGHHRRAAVLSPPRQHHAPDPGHRKPHRRRQVQEVSPLGILLSRRYPPGPSAASR